MPTPAETSAFPPGCKLIEVHISELQQIFNSLDGDAPLGYLGEHPDQEVRLVDAVE